VTHDGSDSRSSHYTYPSGRPKNKNKIKITAFTVKRSRATKDQGTRIKPDLKLKLRRRRQDIATCYFREIP
jgi:hypothetical protein